MEDIISSLPLWAVQLIDIYGIGYMVAFIVAMLDLSDWKMLLYHKVALSFKLALFSWVYVVKILYVWIQEIRDLNK